MTFAVPLLLLLANQTPTFSEAWKVEQAARSAANAKIEDLSSTPDKMREGLRDLEAILAYTRRPEIEAMEDPLHYQAFILQRNDIYMDMIAGYAKLKDLKNVLQSLREMVRNFDQGNPLTIAAVNRTGAYYGRRLETDEYVRKLMPNAEITATARAIRLRDPNLRFGNYPYDYSEADTISETDRIAGLSTLWSEAKYNFANFDLAKGLDWNEAYASFLPRVRKAKDAYNYYNVLREFMALLSDSHTDVGLPPKLRAQKEVGVGLSTGLIEKEVVVLRAAPDVIRLGVTVGDVIETIDGIPAERYGRERWGRLVSSSTPQDREVRIFGYMLWRGPMNSSVRVRVRKADGVTKELRLHRPSKSLIPSLPPFEFKKLPDGTAYFAFNTCETNEPAEAFEANLDAIRTAGRLVIDVRANGGGDGGVGLQILSHLIDHEMSLPKWETPQYRAVYRAWNRPQERFEGPRETVKPDAKQFSGPVVVLTSARTFSAAEDFAAACKISGRVTLVGEPTGGSTGQPLLIRLPGGGYARVCAKRDRYPDGADYVGKGVIPDVEVLPTLTSVQRNSDLQLEQALKLLRDRAKS